MAIGTAPRAGQQGPGPMGWGGHGMGMPVDLILVMRHGSIVEQGTHDQSLAQQGFYADLYNSQFTGRMLKYVTA